MRNDMEININDILCNIKKMFCNIFRKIGERKEVAIFLVEIGIIIAYAVVCNISHDFQEKNASCFGFDSKNYYTAECIKIWDEYGCSVFFEDNQEEVCCERQCLRQWVGKPLGVDGVEPSEAQQGTHHTHQCTTCDKA